MTVTPTRPRILQRPKQSFFLFGPRGSGKSTWVKATFPYAHAVDLLDEDLFHRLLADPALFAARLRPLPRESWVWIDEVQRLPNLLNEAHRFIEERRLRFVLSGSSARKLRRTGVNLLAGRALRKTMFPFVPEEFGASFDLDDTLAFGSLPIVFASPDKAETLKAYVQTYLREEIQAEALVRNLAGFARFLPVAAVLHAQELNISGLARDAGVSRTTVAGYLEILEDTLLAFTLPAFESGLRVRERRHPKLYWVDPGIVRGVKRQLGPLTAEERGPLFEGWLATLLRAYGEHRGLFDEMFYWRPADSTRAEVDFLLSRQGRYLAIEAKSSPRPSLRELFGLRAIAKLPGLARRILVYNGKEALQTEDGIEVWPVERLLKELGAGTLWDVG